MAEAVNTHLEVEHNESLQKKQYEVAMISEMYHTASLFHDDVIGWRDILTPNISTPKFYIIFATIHGWGGCIVAMRECSTIARSLYFLISTYQVSSAWLEMQSAQRKKEKVCSSTGDWTRDLPLAGRMLWPLSYRGLVLSVQSWAFYIILQSSMDEEVALSQC